VRVYVDTSAFYAVLDADDQHHPPARDTWVTLLEEGASLFTSNYNLVETCALLQHRLGLDALRVFRGQVLPVLNVIWVDEEVDRAAWSALLTAGRRRLSLVDCVSFEVMRRAGIGTAFTLDPHFGEQGFTVVPAPKDSWAGEEPRRPG